MANRRVLTKALTLGMLLSVPTMGISIDDGLTFDYDSMAASQAPYANAEAFADVPIMVSANFNGI